LGADVTAVFVSYARDDEAVARRVAKALEASGHTVWWDAHLPAHRSYSEIIERNLKNAEAVVVLWSKAAAQSQWVRAEADFARTEGKLVQAQVDGTMPPLPFNQVQCADLKGWRGSTKHSGWSKLAGSVSALGVREAATSVSTVEPKWWATPRMPWIAAIGALLLMVAAFLVPRFVGGGEAERPIVAVLPFESLASRDASLVAGIWEDTRQALSRNPYLLVLGPNSSRELADKEAKATRKAANYLVEATVRSAGDRIRVSANLVRTEDNVQVWSETFERRLDDVFQLQQDIAGEIEGRIRGRLARKGGVLPENIVTSGEVYALYSDARAKLRRRDSLRYIEARQQLRQVVKKDPNFAPGWATLSVAEQFYGPSWEKDQDGLNEGLSEAHARRAIALAPNLAAGYSALGLALKQGPAAEASLHRAIKLDPNDFESVYWLASLYKGREGNEEALKLYSRAVEIEPLFWPAVLSRLDLLLDRGEDRAVEREMSRLKSAGDPTLIALAGMEIARARGDLSEAARLGLALLRANPDRSQGIVGFPLFGILLQLGFVEEADRVFPPPAFGPSIRNNDPRALDMVESLGLRPKRFFALHPLPMGASRVYVLSGRGKRLAELYHEAAHSPEDMRAISGSDLQFVKIAPYIALGLRDAGEAEEAKRVLELAERLVATRSLDSHPNERAFLARILATQGRGEKALAELDKAIRDGWLPVQPEMQNDIALDPSFASIRSDRRFATSRNRVLAHLRKERSELGPVQLTS
jgi:TolB-like protein/tetratricopeptide (TPR) repeat protein